MPTPSTVRRTGTVVAALLGGLSLVACGGDSSTTTTAGSSASAGGAAAGGSGGNSGSSSSSAGTGGNSSTGGSGGSAGVGGSGGDCPSQGTVHAAVRVSVPVNWSSSTGLDAGSGAFTIWRLVSMTFDGTLDVQTEVRPCGLLYPPVVKNIGYEGPRQLLLPAAPFDAAGIATASGSGTIASFAPDATFSLAATETHVGTTSPGNSWPAWHQLSVLDADLDNRDGLTGMPNDAEGFVPQAISGSSANNDPWDGSQADLVGVAYRVQMALDGQRSSCLEATGSATISRHDRSIVYCHTADDGDCDFGEVSFMNNYQVDFNLGPGSFHMRRIEQPSCVAARTALP